MRESMEIEELNGSAVERLSPNTLSDLFKRFDEDTQKVENEDKTLLPQHVLQQTSLPFVLSFCKLTYAIIDNKKKKTLILNDVSGQARSGEILAILGTSGSGKSTLIDALANQIAKGSLKGSITLNGKPVVESGLLKVISGYVMQDDLLFPMLTVEETIMFSAEFRLPHSLSKSKKKARVSALIDQLGLRSVAKTMIGDEGHRGVSGGERRRVSIGIEIIHDPIILFLDEPTSGLDCTNAFLVVEVLKRIAQSGSIVIMSIHQPSYRILGLLNRLLFLSCGQIVYSGLPASLPLFFTEFGHSIPENENWVEFAFDLIHELEESPSGMESLVEFSKSWQTINQPHTLDSNHLKLSLKEAITASMLKGKLVSGALNNSASPTSSIATFANPFWNEIFVLSKRSITNSRRMPELIRTRLGPVMVTSFMLALVFRQLDNSPKGIKERLGFFGFALCTIFYFCTDALPVFILERYIFMRETANNAYRRSSYILSTTIVVIPSLIFLSTAFAATTFWAVGLGGGISGFIFFASIIFALFWAGNSFVTFLSAIVSDLMIGCTVVVAIVGYFLLFSGISINSDRIPHYLIWLHYTSLMKYSYQAVLQNEFENERKCFMRGTQMFDNTELGIVPVAMKINLLKKISNSLGMNITSESCLTTGLDILGRQGIRNNLSKWDCLWITLAWGFFFRILFYFSLLLGSKNKRR